VSRRTANKKLTKLYWPSRKRSPTRLIVPVAYSQKSGGARQTNFSQRFVPDVCHQIRSRATMCVSSLYLFSAGNGERFFGVTVLPVE